MKDYLYSNGVASALSSTLLSKDIYSRLVDAKGVGEALSILSETSFGLSNSSQSTSLSKEEVVKAELNKLIDFIKKESPSQNFLQILLLPYDYANITTYIKCGGDASFDALVEIEGLYSLPQIKEFVQSKNYLGFDNKYLKSALMEVDSLNNQSGWETDFIFKKHLYKNLLELSKKDNILKSLVVNKIDCENLSVCMRAKTRFELESQLLCGGNLGKKTIIMLFEKKSSAVDEIKSLKVKKLAKIVLEGTSYSKFEKLRNCLEINILDDLKYNIESIAPFAYYVYKKMADIKNVRLILSYQENGLGDKIKNKLLGV